MCWRHQRRAGVSRITYVASSTCYGIPDSYPTPGRCADPGHNFPMPLLNTWARSWCSIGAGTYDLPANVLRFFNVYGPRARTSGTYGAVFGVFLAQMLADQLLTIVGDGEQTRDFTFVSDVVDALVTTASSDLRDQVLNVGSRRAGQRQTVWWNCYRPRTASTFPNARVNLIAPLPT